jgi:hypothetical protein
MQPKTLWLMLPRGQAEHVDLALTRWAETCPSKKVGH